MMRLVLVLAFACRGLGGVVPEFDDMEVWRPGMPSFLLVYQTPCEGPCAALMDLWEAAAKKFPGLMRVLPRGRCPGAASTPGSTPRLSAVCELAFPEGSSPAGPDVVVWTGEKYERYAGRAAPASLLLAPLDRARSLAASLPRPRRGLLARPSRAPAEALELYSFESSPFSRLVRERLCELELPYRLRNAGKAQWQDMGPPQLRAALFADTPVRGRNRRALLARAGRVQFPYLIDPNTGVALFESARILDYLEREYAR